MPLSSAEYLSRRGDLQVNWDRAHDPAWIAANPDSQGVVDYILKFGSLDDYLRADYGQAFSDDRRSRDEPNKQDGGLTTPPSSVGSENTYPNIPGSPGYVDPNDLTIPINNNPSVIGSSTYDPTGGRPIDHNGVQISTDPLDNSSYTGTGGGLWGTGGNGGFGTILPLPVDLGTAIGASILLSNGNIFGGGGSLSSTINSAGNVLSNPIGSVISSAQNLGGDFMGPQIWGLGGTAAAATAGAIAWPSGGSSSPPPPNQSTGSNTTVIPATPGSSISFPGGAPTQDSGATVTAGTSILPAGSSISFPGGPPPNQGNPATVNIFGVPPTTISPGGGVTTPPPPETPGTSTTIVPTTTDKPTTPTTIVPPVTTPTTTTTGGTGVTPIIPVVPTNTTTMPTPGLPTPRNYYAEGNQSTQDLGQLWQQIAQLYGNASGAYGNSDYTNYNNIANQFGGSNANLTGIANQQTAGANTSLRTGNLNDVQNLYGQALNIRNQANPGLFGDTGALNSYTNGAQQQLQYAQNQQAQAGNLSPEDVRNSQQAAREAWGARGLVNSNGAVGAEILNRSNLTQQRQQQAFANTNTALGNMQGVVGAQQANQFDPFGTILGAQYGQQTNNAGSNQNLFGQAAGISSGAYGNQFAANAFNPYNNYSQDVYNTNYNAANAQYLSGQNNQAALQGANTQANAQLLNNFLGSLAGLYGSGAFSCWVARAIFGEDSPKVQKFRRWMLTTGPRWFRNLYVKHGEAFATWLQDHAWLKPAIRAFMESRINSLLKEDFAHAL